MEICSVVTTLETLKREAAEVQKKVDETASVMEEVRKKRSHVHCVNRCVSIGGAYLSAVHTVVERMLIDLLLHGATQSNSSPLPILAAFLPRHLQQCAER